MRFDQIDILTVALEMHITSIRDTLNLIMRFVDQFVSKYVYFHNAEIVTARCISVYSYFCFIVFVNNNVHQKRTSLFGRNVRILNTEFFPWIQFYN